MLVQPPEPETLWSLVQRWGEIHPERAALITDDEVISYGALVSRVEGHVRDWGLSSRSLVALAGTNRVGFVVSYLATVAAGHVPMIVNPSAAEPLVERWQPAAVVNAAGDGLRIERRAVPGREMHPDLGLLLSTSGSTGSPKLVRLSHRGIVANAAAIAQYLALSASDRAITTLPLHYCYGLSVLHSHLAVGASIVLNEASVVDPCFQRRFRQCRVTNLAGVPHTFDLLEHSGFLDLDLPDLRFVTQAGGRLPSDRVSAWAERLGATGVELFVMYGQTEATARMAYLPPRLASVCPGAIGIPIPGGSFELRPHPAAPDPAVGELVYRGANVMMGYAESPADLARGPELEALHTGDLARRGPEGVYEIVGRASRFVKPFGLRIELDHLEATLRESQPVVALAGDDRRVVVAITHGPTDPTLAATVKATGLPTSLVHVVVCTDPPRTPNGKIDEPALLELAPPLSNGGDRPPASSSVAALYTEVLDQAPTSGDDTFVSLGGDSLSYVECSTRLQERLGRLPLDWHLTPIDELERLVAGRPRSMVRVDTTVVLRAFSICAVVSTHMRLHRFPGGAHLLLAVAGYNFARFQLAIPATAARVRSTLRTAFRVGAPASAWIGLNMLIAGGYSVGALLLVNNYTGSAWRRDGRWQYWFFEVFVQLMVFVSLLLAVPAVRRLERRAPFGFAVAFAVPCLVFRFGLVELGGEYNYLFRTHTVAWFFALGWMVAASSNRWQRLLVSLAGLAVVPGFFGRGQREAFIVAGLLLLVWLPTIPLPRLLRRPVSELAASSMWIFLIHWQVWPIIDAPLEREVAYVLTIAVGVGVARVTRRWPSRLWPLRVRPHERAPRPAWAGSEACSGPTGEWSRRVVDGTHQDPVSDEGADADELLADLERQRAVR